MYVELIETTVWKDNPNMPNHTYYLNDAGKCIAYRNVKDGKLTFFKSPMMFSKKLRKFKTKKLKEMPK